MYNRRFPFHHTPASGKRLDFIRIMIAIIAEKPSVGQDIARVVGATEKKDGYIVGNGYMVTWALGHLVSLALPDAYGYTRTAAEDLPMIPDPFRLVVRQVRTDRGMVTDIAAGRQLKVIGEVLAGCESIIVATDAGREGELIFRWIYSYLGCTKPFKRLWISSLTDEAIREGMASLKEGTGYDSLYAAADSRAKADWLVGMNASRALAAASGSVNNSIGRVQTPTLAMICARFKENRNFVSTPYWQLHIVLKRDNGHRQFIHTKEFKDKNMAEAAYKSITPGSVVTITKVKRGKIFQQAPLLYDLTALQKDCNIHYDLPVDKTLAITQSLYEKKLVSYPRTGSRYIPQDVMAHIPVLLEKITAMPEFREYRRSLDLSALNTRSVDAAKVTDHHAIIPTIEITKTDLSAVPEGEMKILSLVANRLLCATGKKQLYETVKAEFSCGGYSFHVSGKTVLQNGWKEFEAALKRTYRVEKTDEDKEEKKLPELSEGMTFPVIQTKVTEHFTQPPKHFTEDSLLSAMERAGAEDMGDEVERKGLGTPATRADIIEKLVKDGFVKREKKQMLPTEDGMKLITVLPDMVKSPKLTADWENTLTLVEKGEYTMQEFMDGIEDMVRELVQTYHSISDDQKSLFGTMQEVLGKCPKCGSDVVKGKFGAYCKQKCGMNVGRAMGATFSDTQMKSLLEGKKTLVRGLKGKKGSYDAYLIPEGIEDYSYIKDGKEIKGSQYKFKMEFPPRKSK